MDHLSHQRSPVTEISAADFPIDGFSCPLLPSETLHYLVKSPVGEPDQWGVTIHIDDVHGSARIQVDVPEALSPECKKGLRKVEERVVVYTDNDREWDRVAGAPPTSYNEASEFVRSVLELVGDTHDGLTSAVFAYARNELWDA